MILKKSSSGYSEPNNTASRIPLSSGSELLDSLMSESAILGSRGAAIASTTLLEQMPVVYLHESCLLDLSLACAAPNAYKDTAQMEEGRYHNALTARKTQAERILADETAKPISSSEAVATHSARDCAVERLARVIQADRQSLKGGIAAEKRITTTEDKTRTAA